MTYKVSSGTLNLCSLTHADVIGHTDVYCVCVCVSSEIADVIGHTDVKIVSDANLPYLVRQMAVHADVRRLIFLLSDFDWLQRKHSTAVCSHGSHKPDPYDFLA